jgi:tetratricopeptide (TPR) repeat protein
LNQVTTLIIGSVGAATTLTAGTLFALERIDLGLVEFILILIISWYSCIWTFRGSSRRRFLLGRVEAQLTPYLPVTGKKTKPVKAQNIRQSIHDLDELITLDQDGTQWHFMKGKAHQLVAEYEAALASFGEALQGDPDHGDLMNEYAVAAIELGDFDRAGKVLRKGIRIHPDHMALAGNEVLLNILTGKISKAAKLARKLQGRYPNEPMNLLFLQIADEIIAGKREQPTSYQALKEQTLPKI